MAESALVTGATGLVGGALARAFAADGMRVVAPVRDIAKARRVLADVPGVVFVKWDMSHPSGGALAGAGRIDRVVHAASPTSGRFFAEHPAETESMIADSTRALLDLSCSAGAKAFVFLSSMEAYGAPPGDAPLGEDAPFFGDFGAPRSSYARGKRRAEALCAEYARTRGLRAMSVRLAQTFGTFVPASENRVFAQLLRSALAGGTLRLSSSGGSTRMYLETMDAVAAIRTVLEKGAAGEVYNAANPATYCSLADMARMVCARFGGAGVSLGRDDDPANACYPPTHHLRLDVSRLLALGWRPRHSLEEMFDRMAPCLGQCR